MIYILPTDTCYWIATPINDIKNYEKIYKIKKRNLNKPLAILVKDFEWLTKYTDLNEEQIKFLRNYKNPFTILCDSSYIKLWLNFVNEENGGEEFINRWVYEKIAFRVANNSEQKKLIKENWSLFLTSANISDEKELYSNKEIKETFSYYLDKWIIKFIENKSWNLQKKSPSEIFEFEWETTTQIFLRK